MTKERTIERTVDRLRQRFQELLPRCGGSDRLSTRLAEIDEYFGTTAGYNDVKNAKRELAGEVPMTRIMSAMEILALQKYTSDVPSRAEKSLERMGIVSAYKPRYPATKELQKKMKNSK